MSSSGGHECDDWEVLSLSLSEGVGISLMVAPAQARPGGEVTGN